MNGRGPRISNGKEGTPPPCLRNGLSIGKCIRTFLGDTGKKPSAGLTLDASSLESGGTFCNSQGSHVLHHVLWLRRSQEAFHR